MIKKEEMYLNGTTRGDTLRPFLFHFIMMFVLPILAFFFSRDMFASKGYTEKEMNMYPAFIALFCVIVVMTSYVFHILADKDNWTPENQPSNQKIIPAKKETVSQESKKPAIEKSGKKLTENEITEKNNTNTGDEATKKNKKKENKKTNGDNKEQAKDKSDNPLEKDEIKKRDVPQKSENQNNQKKIEPKTNNSEPSGQEKQIKINKENAEDKTSKKKKK